MQGRRALALLFVVVYALMGSEASAGRDVSRTRTLIRTIALEEGVDPRVLDSIIHNESGYNNSIKGAAGEIGMAQIMPFWARKHGLSIQQLRVPHHNIRTAARIVKLCGAQWRPGYRILGQVHPVLKRRLGGDFTKEVFTAGCYNYGRLAFRLKKTPPERWALMHLPNGNVRYMTRFLATWRKQRAAPFVTARRPSSSSAQASSLLELMRAREQARPPAAVSIGGGRGWVRMVKGRGIRVRNPDKAWGRRWAMDILGGCAARIERRFGAAVGPLVIGDWSHLGGGHMPGHRSHRNGLDVDISYYALRAAWQMRFHSPRPEEMALQPQLAFLRCLTDSRRIVYVFSDTPLIARLRQQAQRQWPAEIVERVFAPIRHWPGHGNHLHVRFADKAR